jgi:hypothetical protein
MEIQLATNAEELMKTFSRNIVEQLATKYNIDMDEALRSLNLEVDKTMKSTKSTKSSGKKPGKKATIPLPFCGKICEENCKTIRLNHGLYTQCTNLLEYEINDYGVCNTCNNQISKIANKKPTYGYVDDRLAKGDDYRDPKGKAPVNYGNVMEKLNISRDEAEAEAKKQGYIIPEDQFEVKRAQRGRPKKDTTAVDTSESDNDSTKSDVKVEKKPRGRPKKDKPHKALVSSAVGDALIDDLVKTVNTNNIVDEKNINIDDANIVDGDGDGDDEDDDDDASIEVAKITYEGKEYLKSSDNTIYDSKTWDEIGKWDEKNSKVVFGVVDED